MPGRERPTPDLAGRVAVVTGSSRGIGRAVALAMAEHGAAVVVNGRDAATVDDAVAQVVDAGGRALGVVGSAADEEVAAALVARAESDLGPVDVLVNCVGVAEPPGSSILDITMREWTALLDSHLTATFAACRAVVPGMVERRRGAIVNSGSHAYTGMYGGTGYAAGKGGVVSLSYALAADLHEHGVRVNVVCPGARTRLSEGEEYEATIASLHRRGLIDDMTREASLAPAGPEHVAPLYVLLASDLAASITGEVLVGAGGYVGRMDRPRDRFVALRDHETSGPWRVAELADLLVPPSSG